MELFAFIILSTIYFSIFYLVYKVFLSKLTYFVTNRIYLLAIILLSLVFPFVEIALPSSNTFLTIQLPEIAVTNNISTLTENNYVNYAEYLYLIITTLFLVLLILKLSVLVLKTRKLKSNKQVDIQPFSFFKFIYIPAKYTKEEQQLILNHEHVHAKQWHSIDVLIAEIFKAFFWFNPLVWMIQNDIKANHEYIADEEASKHTHLNYETALTAHLFDLSITDLANNFNNELLTLKRIKMMKTQKSTTKKALRYFLLIPTMAISLIAVGNIELHAQETQKTEAKQDENGNYILVEKMPEFKGGMDALFKYLGENITYPAEAKEKEIEGKVYVSFLIDKNGAINNVKIVRGVHELLDNEAVRVISAMPKWEPGKHDGKKVVVAYNLPISFKLKEKK